VLKINKRKKREESLVRGLVLPEEQRAEKVVTRWQ